MSTHIDPDMCVLSFNISFEFSVLGDRNIQP
jgi:hypothetical protein